jgi:hypothetical protein
MRELQLLGGAIWQITDFSDFELSSCFQTRDEDR